MRAALRRSGRLLACALLVVPAATGPTLASDPSTYEEAVAAFQDGDYETAATRFEELIEVNPSWAPGHVVLGQCYFLLDRPERGEHSILEAQKLDPETDLYKAFYGAGQLLFEQKLYDRAVPPLERALESASPAQRQSTLLRLGYSYLMAERHRDARRAFETRQSEHGADADTSYFLALACQQLNDYPCALENLRRVEQAGQAATGGRKVLEYLAKWSHQWALLAENKPRRDELLVAAVDETRAWFEADPDNPAALRYYAETLLATGRAEQAVELLAPLARRDAGSCVAHTLLAKTLNALGDGPQAQARAEQALRCDPSSGEAHIELAVAHIHQLRVEHSSLEQVREDQQRLRETRDLLRNALELESALDARAAALLADAQETLDRLDRAEADFIARDTRHAIDVTRAQQEQISRRCQNIRWMMEHDPARVSREDEEFDHEHDCKQYAK